MKEIRIGLNGFGRIGRAIARIASGSPHLTLVAINTASSRPPALAYALQYDSVYRKFEKVVSSSEARISIGKESVACYNFTDPLSIPWEKHDVDIVIDCSGVFKTRLDLQKHLRGSVKKVIVTVPTDDVSISHVVMGVNNENKEHVANDIISNCSCTTNCAAVMAKVLNDAFGIEKILLSTTHAYTSSQSLVDEAGSKPTRTRAAGLSIVPTTTGASKTLSKVIPGLREDMIAGVALRVPTPVGSIVDLSCEVKKKTTREEVDGVFQHASEHALKGFMAYETTPLVSADYVGSPFSCTYDANYTCIVGDRFVKVLGWYDNEWGYASRVVDLVNYISLSS